MSNNSLENIRANWNKIRKNDINVINITKTTKTTGSNDRVFKNENIINESKTGTGKTKSVKVDAKNNVDSFVQTVSTKELPKGGYVVGGENFNRTISLESIENLSFNPEDFNIDNKGFELLKKYENFFTHPVMTENGEFFVGYGTKVSIKDAQYYYWKPITKDDAESLLNERLSNSLSILKTNVDIPLIQTQINALVSLIFNIGKDEFENSEVLKRINKKDFFNSGKYFGLHNTLRFMNQKYQTRGLINRRTEESSIFTTLPNSNMAEPSTYPNPNGSTRGYKNHNPGFIKKPSDDDGLWKNQNDSVYVQFNSAESGTKAIAKRILRNRDKYRRRNLVEIMSVWLEKPYKESLSIINSVSDITGIPPRVPLNLFDESTLANIVSGIMEERNNGKLDYGPNELRLGTRRALIELI